MGPWRSILRWFGLQREARVQITAPGIEVTLAGDPAQVRSLMGVIRAELERKARRDRRMTKAADSQIVRPTELDEMDSPYAFPEAVVMPVPDDEPSEARRARRAEMTSEEPPTLPPPLSASDVHLTTDPSLQVAGAPFGADDVEAAQTALTAHPRDWSPVPSLADRPTPPLVHGVRAVSPTDLETLEVDRRTRPLHPTVKSDPS